MSARALNGVASDVLGGWRARRSRMFIVADTLGIASDASRRLLHDESGLVASRKHDAGSDQNAAADL